MDGGWLIHDSWVFVSSRYSNFFLFDFLPALRTVVK